MSTLRLVLAVWLSLSVPMSALGSITSAEHCSRMAATETSAADPHAGHDMQGMSDTEHLQHMAKVGAATKVPANDCRCGCNCTSHHCVSSASGLMTGAYAVVSLSVNDGLHAHAGPSRTAAAHHLDLLRPPSLT